MSDPLPEDVRLTLSAGQKLEAIRLLREHTGLDLAEAKAAVESGALASDAAQAAPVETLPPVVVVALAQGNKVEAIRLLREARGLGLKEAKDTVDAFQRGPEGQGLQTATQRSAMESGSRIRLLIVIAAAVATVLWLWFRRG